MINVSFILAIVIICLLVKGIIMCCRRLQLGIYLMAFRKIIFAVLVLILLTGGFYYGYQKAQYTKKSVLLSSNVISNSGSMATKDISFEYQLKDPKDFETGSSDTFSSFTCDLEGVFTIDDLVSTIIRNCDAFINIECVVNTEKDLQNKKYKLHLIYPRKAASLEFLNQLGDYMGFGVVSYDTEVPWYRAVRNNNPIVFEINKAKRYEHFISQQTCTFYDFSMEDILHQFGYLGFNYDLKIDDETGIKEKFNGVITLSSNPEDVKNELASKAGVELIPFQKKVKYFEVRKR